MTPRGPKRAAIYIRISRDRPTEVSTQIQERDCRAYADSKGWEVVEVYSDLGLSASKTEVVRPGYDRLLRAAALGEFDVIVFWKLDRFGRSVIELNRVAERLRKQRVAIASVNDSLDTTTPGGKFVFQVLAALAEMESAQISMRVTAAQGFRASQGKPHGGGTRTYGYGPGGLAVVEEEAALILEAAQRVIDGEGTTAIARDWNARGIPTATGRGKWHPARIGSILLNRHVAGQRTYHGTIVEGTWPAIISPELREQVLEVVSDPDNRGRPWRRTLLSGLAVCSKCGARLVRGQRGEEERYVCKSTDFTPGCGGTIVTGAPVDREVRDRTLLLLSQSPQLATAGQGANVVELETRVADLRERRTLLTNEFAAGRLSQEEWGLARRTLTESLEPLELQLIAAQRAAQPDVPERLPRDLPGLEWWWEEADLDRRRALLRAVIEKVEILPPQRRGPGAVEERVRVHWRG
ncbi:MAG: recombinase family protein [Actinomycetota bacterium]